jgi:hypothetical protein
MSEKTSHASVPLRASCTVPATRGVMFLLLFDFLLLLLVFHALLTPDLGVRVPIPEHQTIYEKNCGNFRVKKLVYKKYSIRHKKFGDVYSEKKLPEQNRAFV